VKMSLCIVTHMDREYFLFVYSDFGLPIHAMLNPMRLHPYSIFCMTVSQALSGSSFIFFLLKHLPGRTTCS
jgi:hypothetical protein